ncbi:hypothetical protein Nmel_014938 [Mimus melanotis]
MVGLVPEHSRGGAGISRGFAGARAGLQLPQGLRGRCWLPVFPRWLPHSPLPTSSWFSRGFPSITVEPPSRPSLPEHHGITPTTGASPWGLHLWDITTSMVHHRLLFFDVPEACADPLQLPSWWLGRRRDLPYFYWNIESPQRTTLKPQTASSSCSSSEAEGNISNNHRRVVLPSTGCRSQAPKAELSRSTFLRLSPGDVLLGCQAGTRPASPAASSEIRITRGNGTAKTHGLGGGRRHHRREQGQERACRHEALVNPTPPRPSHVEPRDKGVAFSRSGIPTGYKSGSARCKLCHFSLTVPHATWVTANS